MSAYTDDEVIEALTSLLALSWHTGGPTAEEVLDLVAPAIAAQALREAADDIETERNDHWFSAFDAVTRLRSRAEAVGK